MLAGTVSVGNFLHKIDGKTIIDHHGRSQLIFGGK